MGQNIQHVNRKLLMAVKCDTGFYGMDRPGYSGLNKPFLVSRAKVSSRKRAEERKLLFHNCIRVLNDFYKSQPIEDLSSFKYCISVCSGISHLRPLNPFEKVAIIVRPADILPPPPSFSSDWDRNPPKYFPLTTCGDTLKKHLTIKTPQSVNELEKFYDIDLVSLTTLAINADPNFSYSDFAPVYSANPNNPTPTLKNEKNHKAYIVIPKEILSAVSSKRTQSLNSFNSKRYYNSLDSEISGVNNENNMQPFYDVPNNLHNNNAIDSFSNNSFFPYNDDSRIQSSFLHTPPVSSSLANNKFFFSRPVKVSACQINSCGDQSSPMPQLTTPTTANGLSSTDQSKLQSALHNGCMSPKTNSSVSPVYPFSNDKISEFNYVNPNKFHFIQNSFGVIPLSSNLYDERKNILPQHYVQHHQVLSTPYSSPWAVPETTTYNSKVPFPPEHICCSSETPLDLI